MRTSIATKVVFDKEDHGRLARFLGTFKESSGFVRRVVALEDGWIVYLDGSFANEVNGWMQEEMRAHVAASS